MQRVRRSRWTPLASPLHPHCHAVGRAEDGCGERTVQPWGGGPHLMAPVAAFHITHRIPSGGDGGPRVLQRAVPVVDIRVCLSIRLRIRPARHRTPGTSAPAVDAPWPRRPSGRRRTGSRSARWCASGGAFRTGLAPWRGRFGRPAATLATASMARTVCRSSSLSSVTPGSCGPAGPSGRRKPKPVMST
jgi:hypothetical protein